MSRQATRANSPFAEAWNGMQLGTLESASVRQMADALNAAFSDYVVPMHLSEEQFARKLQADSTDVSLSGGAYVDDEVIAFILHGYREIDGVRWIYNGGTGVRPAYRGQSLTRKLFDLLLPKLEARGVQRSVLEVVTDNQYAIRIYRDQGYETRRHLLCFKGTRPAESTVELNCRWIGEPDWSELATFWETEPSWQNTPESLRNKHSMRTLGAYIDDRLAGHATFSPAQGRVAVFGINPEFRGKGVGSSLIAEVQSRSEEALSFINIASTAEDSLRFLDRLGFELFLEQYEMVLEL